MDVNVVKDLITTVGVPVFFCLFFMTKLDKNLEKNNQLLAEVATLLSQLIKTGD